MNIPEMIAKGLISVAVMVDVFLLKKDDHEHQDHTHQEEPFAEATTQDGQQAIPDGVTPTPFTVRRFFPEQATPVTDYAYSWEGVKQSVSERYRMDNPNATEATLEITDRQDTLGAHWLFTFVSDGVTTCYRIQQWGFCDPTLRISKADRKARFSWVNNEKPNVVLNVDEKTWEVARLTIGTRSARYRRAGRSANAPDARYWAGADLEPHLLDVVDFPNEVDVLFAHNYEVWRFVRDVEKK